MKTTEILTWATSVLTSKGYRLVGAFKELKAVPWSSVYVNKTAQGDVYLKQMAKGFTYEPRVIDILNKNPHVRCPEIIDTNGVLSCFLMKDGGVPLRKRLNKRYDFEIVCDLLSSYTRMQISSQEDIERLLASGAMDFRLDNLPALYRQFFVQYHDLLISAGVNIGGIQRLKALSESFRVLCVDLQAYRIPEMLEHGDFHDNNILIDRACRITICDFGDAAISHPFFSLAGFLASAERHHDLKRNEQSYLQLRDAYLNPFSAFAAYGDLVRAFHLSYRLRPFVWLLSFMRIFRCCKDAERKLYQHYLTDGICCLIDCLSVHHK